MVCMCAHSNALVSVRARACSFVLVNESICEKTARDCVRVCMVGHGHGRCSVFPDLSVIFSPLF